jgi:hypothetical protein
MAWMRWPGVPNILGLMIAFPLLPAQCKKEVELFIRYGARVRWEVDAPHKFGDTVLCDVVDTGNFGLSLPVRHGYLPSIRKAFTPYTEREYG